MNSVKVFCLMAVITVFGACKKPKIAETNPAFNAKSPEFILKSAMQLRNFNFYSMAFKAKTEVVTKESSTSFTANTRMQYGEKVWSSITVLIEAARVYIEKDSVMVRDNLNKKVYFSNMRYLEQFTSTSLNITQLQNLLVGNPIFTDSTYTFVEMQGDSLLVVKAAKGPISNKLHIENYTFNILTSVIEDAISGQKLTVNYSNFEPINATNLPKRVSLNTYQNGGNVVINMNYEDISMDTITSYPFAIPPKFEVINK